MSSKWSAGCTLSFPDEYASVRLLFRFDRSFVFIVAIVWRRRFFTNIAGWRTSTLAFATSQVDQSSCRNLKKPAGFGDFRVGSRRFSSLPIVSEPFLTGSLPPDSCRMFSDNSGNFPVGLQPDLSGTYRNR